MTDNPGKPATHSHIPRWRVFVKEVAIIVLGVGIALAAQQAVETWRERQQYLEAREAMRFELANNIASLGPRDVISPCNQNRLAEISVLLDKAEKRQDFTPPSWLGEAASARLRYAAENEAGRSGLFSPAEQRSFGRFYSFLHSIDTEQDRERQAWARLQPLEGRSSVPPEMIANLRQALAEARFEDERIMFLRGFIQTITDEISLAVMPVDPAFWPKAWPTCLPMNTPRQEARRLTAYNGRPWP